MVSDVRAKPAAVAAATLAAASLAIALAACSGGAGPTPLPEVRITTEAAPSNACMEALITGVLVPHGAWGLALQAPGNGELSRPMFPFGYRALLEGDRVVLIDEDGRVVARSADLIQSSGGSIGREGNPLVVLCDDTIVVVNAGG
ncbi:MAG: hypothetical protein AB1736_12365 [Chloroflexota bacterium]